jgi:hypothetical protein
MTLNIMTLSVNNTQHNDTQHNVSPYVHFLKFSLVAFRIMTLRMTIPNITTLSKMTFRIMTEKNCKIDSTQFC